ncbi:MAG: hypothetical protein MUO29_10430 [Desulfobacterales bacterium]|nr:hypothetical protein [Desulfobacterales bacterium]
MICDFDIGRVRSIPKYSKGIDAKFRIAELLGIEMNGVSVFKQRVGKEF